MIEQPFIQQHTAVMWVIFQQTKGNESFGSTRTVRDQ